MSTIQITKTLNQVEKELVDLEKKLADETKKEADKTKKIHNLQKSITKNTSMATAQSKLRQIQVFKNDLVKISKIKSDINKKIADKRKKRAEVLLKLQKEQQSEAKKLELSQKNIQLNYENQISNLSAQLLHRNEPQENSKNFYTESDNNEEYDVFISHATEDKENFVEDLCKELQNIGIKVWYDALSISWGDSLRSKIDNGLNKSKYGIVVLSKDYIQKGWTNYELDGLFQKEMMGGKIILPIWHNISKKEVQDFSSSLAGRLALNTSMMTPIEIANELKKILGLNEVSQEDTND